jgi:hypothetical protein
VESSFAVLHGLFWLTANLADRGALLIVVDDLHCCDPPSLRFVTYLARRLEGLPVVLAVGLRPRSRARTASCSPSSRRPARDRAAPGGAERRRRRRARAEPPRRSARRRSSPLRVHEVTGGNPLLLHELLTAVELEAIEPTADSAARVRALGPETIAARVLGRIGGLARTRRRSRTRSRSSATPAAHRTPPPWPG